jgi:hypothetical protein
MLVEWVVADEAAAPPEIAIDALRRATRDEAPAIDVLTRLICGTCAATR